MFITVKRHEREKQELIGAGSRLTEAILKSSPLGLFLLDGKDRIQPQVSATLAALFRRQDFTYLSFEKLIAPLVTAKTLSSARTYVGSLLDPSRGERSDTNPLQNVEMRLPNGSGGHDTVHYSFDFTPVDMPHEARIWLVSVSDITARVQQTRELDELRAHGQAMSEILRTVLQSGGAPFGAFLQKTDAAMKTINGVLKKPAREAAAFRHKLEETLEEVDRVRRDAAAFKLTGLEGAARLFEDALQELRSRGSLSGSDFLPLAVKLDELYGQFASLRSLVAKAAPSNDSQPGSSPETRMTANGTQIIEAPQFIADRAQRATQQSSQPPQPATQRAPRRIAQAGTLDSTLATLTDVVAQEQHKTVLFECSGMELVPPRYQATIKNIAIQLIRNAVVHGIETPTDRARVGKPENGSLQLEFKAARDGSFELLFQDDGRGVDPDKIRQTAIAKGLVTPEAAARLRDRQAIKLIFKSGFTTMESSDGNKHGAGMSLVRRYVHEAGGKIALASLLGHETRFKVTLPALDSLVEAVADTAVVDGDAQVA